MSFPTSWNPFGAFLSCTCCRSELDYASVNAEAFCTKDILSQTLCSEDDFRQLPGRRLRPRLRVWSLALMAFLTSSLMCSLPSQVWEKVFLLLFLFSVNASPGFHPQCDVKWNSRRESAHFRINLTLFSKLIQNDSFLSLLVETSTVLLKDNFVWYVMWSPVVVLNPVLSFWVLALCQGSMYGVERCPVFVLPPLTVHSQRPLSRDVLSHLCRAIDS